ncbi:unnamed protein product [Blumeria hordei]|uniref:Uncharacterized protein n=1 Tax=Blumeria hordei TaxID=2867405 RepID=A0A383UY38_BLUHO|nr:unnamed protein product [Blumeria hordei]
MLTHRFARFERKKVASGGLRTRHAISIHFHILIPNFKETVRPISLRLTLQLLSTGSTNQPIRPVNDSSGLVQDQQQLSCQQENGHLV